MRVCRSPWPWPSLLLCDDRGKTQHSESGESGEFVDLSSRSSGKKDGPIFQEARCRVSRGNTQSTVGGSKGF